MIIGLVLVATAVMAMSVGPSIFSSLWGWKWRRTAIIVGTGIVLFHSVWSILEVVLVELRVATLAAVLTLKLLNTGASALSTRFGPSEPATGS
ncbi:hypothetical protein [Arthrobacter sp. H14-L1]|uniref:hypothetical protein n=1 Tax=Arthrobacter sp. H14-L1 TaxID=2996697 RepID=UPI002270A5AF|nr:hypothetical protein [Arthrobacter sp. H14-L1]MCY0905929.1 hypothetical protein [Arthrobacter sp. H14-L1]